MSESTAETSAAAEAAEAADVVVVGAGFAGMYMLHRLRGLGLRTVVFEAGDDVGGTWYWNRYPGARVDVECINYSFSFSPELGQDYPWAERYAPQPDILTYARHVADRFELRRDIRFETRVTEARYDEPSKTWHVKTDRGSGSTGRSAPSSRTRRRPLTCARSTRWARSARAWTRATTRPTTGTTCTW